MLKKLFHRLTGFSAKVATAKAVNLGTRKEYSGKQHGIDAKDVTRAAHDVVRILQQAGYQAFIVGGAVRDLLLGLHPKDFDVATNATPEQVRKEFRRAFFVGRRFRIVHVVLGRETIEVTTFRGQVSGADFEPEAIEDEHAVTNADHVVDKTGRILRDNVWGSLEEDAARRDFTVNAMYYDPIQDVVVDFHNGMRDLEHKKIRMIGQAEGRYREDPVRILRALRFSAKLGFGLEKTTQEPIARLWQLLKDVPSARLTDETLKMLQGGYAVKCVETLRKANFPKGLSRFMDLALQDDHTIVQQALSSTDQRVAEGKPLSASFMVACLMWPKIDAHWQRRKANAEPDPQAIIDALDDAQNELDTRQTRRIYSDVAEMLVLQTRFERRTLRAAETLVLRPRFRAALDLLKLRALHQDVDESLPAWWESYYAGDQAKRGELLSSTQTLAPVAAKRKRRRRTSNIAKRSSHE